MSRLGDTHASLAERFRRGLRRVESGCLEWQRKLDSDGYGKIRRGGKGTPHVRSHRLAWELANGPIQEGMSVLHKCDNPPCCDVEHLFLGTNIDNMADMTAKGRKPHGANAHRAMAKLTEQQVKDIRANYALCRVRQWELAHRFGVGQDVISRIVNGKAWSHV